MSRSVLDGASNDQTATNAAGDVQQSDSIDTSELICTTIPNTGLEKNKTTNTTPRFVENTMFLKHKRRYCRKEGCNSIVKSQGLCQRHGAKPKTCKVEGCTKQAQGNFDKMCKAHFKAMKQKTTPIPKVENTDVPPPAQGFSVYDEILPNSLNFANESDTRKLPLIVHLKDGFDTLKPPAWHRNEERRARGMFPIDNPAAQLEGWERELVWMEILMLTGVPGASFRHLARAWGRDKGFHMVLAQFICERHGDVERKKRHGEKPSNKTGDNSRDGSNGRRKKRRKGTVRSTSTQSNKVKVGNDGGNGNGSSDYNNEDVGADVWDPSLYGDVDTNEALAAEIFDFTEKEFERVVSKYKQGIPGDMTLSTSSTSNSRNNSVSTTDIAAQAAMTAILGQQHHRTISGITGTSSTGLGQAHHRSYSMMSSVSNGSSTTNNNHGDVLPAPILGEVPPAPPLQPVTTSQSQNPNHDPNGTVAIENNNTLTTLADTESYQRILTSPHGDAMSTRPHQQQMQQPPQIQQQNIYQDRLQLQTPMQVLGLTYQQQAPQQQPSAASLENQVPGRSVQHQMTQQQSILYSSTQSAQEIQTHTQPQQPQGEQQVHTLSQPIAQQISTSTIIHGQPTQQLEINVQAQPQQFSHPVSYTIPSVQQQEQYALASIPPSAQPTQFSQPQFLQKQQPHQQQRHSPHQAILPTKQSEQTATQIITNASYDQHQHQLQNYESIVPTNSLPQQAHAPGHHTVNIPAIHQQHAHQQQQQLQVHQIQYTQTSIAPAPPRVLLVQEPAHAQHELSYSLDEQQQINAQVQAQSQTTMTSLPHVREQQIAHPPYPPQQHGQEHLNQLIGNTVHEPVAQDPLDVHHEMHATQENQTDV